MIAFAPTATWAVLQTKSRQEKAVVRVAAALGHECYFPIVRHERTYGHRRRTVELPLFGGYVFVKCPGDAVFEMADTGRVANVIRVADQNSFEHELSQIRAALEKGAALAAYPFLRVGRRVCVRSGPLKGVEGLVEGRGSENRLVLRIRALGRAVSLEIAPGLLEPLG